MNFEIVVRGDGRTVAELVIRDQNGPWATRACTSGYEATKLLSGWSRHYDCDADWLLLVALEGAPPDLANLLQRWSVVSSGRDRVHRFVSPDGVKRMMELAPLSYRPQEILELKREIEAETRVAEFLFTTTGQIDESRIHRIVGMKLRLDGLYGAWAEGDIN